VFGLLAFYAFAVGACVGSFLNVVIHRIPIEESIVFPPSRCPACRQHIAWFDNIPIVSWLLLRARCRRCGEPISVRYPLVETANALFYLAIFIKAGPQLVAIPIAILVSMTIALIYIDADIQILPDVIDLPGIAAGFAIGALHGAEHVSSLTLSASLLDSLLGAAAGAGILLVIGMAYKLVRRIEGMGLGDVKMLAMIGAASGWEAIFPTLLLASITGAVFGVFAAARSKDGLQVALPFGVFLGFAWLVVLFFGPTLFGLWTWLLLRS
jgi:leader peptidase (prepilin peptidase)/N-methyltransferase